MSLTFDLYQVEVRDRIAATSTFYGTIDGQLYSQVIVDAIIANGNVLDPEVTAERRHGYQPVHQRRDHADARRRRELRPAPATSTRCKVDWSVAATYTKTDVTGVRATPAEFGTTQPLFDQVALSRSRGHRAEVRGEPRRQPALGSPDRQRARTGVRPVLASGRTTAVTPTARSCSTRPRSASRPSPISRCRSRPWTR